MENSPEQKKKPVLATDARDESSFNTDSFFFFLIGFSFDSSGIFFRIQQLIRLHTVSKTNAPTCTYGMVYHFILCKQTNSQGNSLHKLSDSE